MSGINKSAHRKADAMVDSTGGLKTPGGSDDGSGSGSGGSADGSAASTKKEQAARSDSEDLPATFAEVALCRGEHGPIWSQGIVLIDAAILLAGEPTEGPNHQPAPD
jgi:hypothetical protein